MRRNIFITSKKGFSLIELCVVLAVLAILAGSITPVLIKRVQIKAGEKTALEMSAIQQASLAYYVSNNAWPLNIQALQNAGYLNPSWVSNNPWQNPYNISSTQNSFTVSTTVPSEWTSLVARDLPTSSILQNSVASTVPSPGSDALPSGAIIMWSGSIADIPLGWALCDGTNGTPDLRDRFIVGAGSSYNPASTGGVLTHDHAGLTGIGGDHSHSFSGRTGSDTSGDYRGWNAAPGGSGWNGDASRGWHTHAFSGNTSSAGSHSHSIASVSSLPPYYALAFIMKL